MGRNAFVVHDIFFFVLFSVSPFYLLYVIQVHNIHIEALRGNKQGKNSTYPFHNPLQCYILFSYFARNIDPHRFAWPLQIEEFLCFANTSDLLKNAAESNKWIEEEENKIKWKVWQIYWGYGASNVHRNRANKWCATYTNAHTHTHIPQKQWTWEKNSSLVTILQYDAPLLLAAIVYIG